MSQRDYPVVLRFEGMSPSDLAGFEAHRVRKGGDPGHVDRERSGLNKRLIGDEAWSDAAQRDITGDDARNGCGRTLLS